MLTFITRHWWILALRGLVAVLFGLAAFLWPSLTLTILVFLFGFFTVLDGVFALAVAVRVRKRYDRWWTFLLQGILSIGVAVVAFLWPAITAFALLLLIAFWAIVTGILEVLLAIALRREMEREWLLLVGGALSVIFGILLVFWPGAGILALVWLLGIYALLFGAMLINLGFRVRKLGKTPHRAGSS